MYWTLTHVRKYLSLIHIYPWVGQSCALYFALYNMGKAPIYNCMVDVEGEGLAMEETYFGGTVAAGSTMRADFSIIPSVGGDIAGEIVITYEDAVSYTHLPHPSPRTPQGRQASHPCQGAS